MRFQAECAGRTHGGGARGARAGRADLREQAAL